MDRYDTIEASICSNRENDFTEHYHTHHLSSRLFKRNVEYARDQRVVFDSAAMTDQYARHVIYIKVDNLSLFSCPLDNQSYCAYVISIDILYGVLLELIEQEMVANIHFREMILSEQCNRETFLWHRITI